MTKPTTPQTSASKALLNAEILTGILEWLIRDRADLQGPSRVSRLWQNIAVQLRRRHLSLDFTGEPLRRDMAKHGWSVHFGPETVRTLRIYDEDIVMLYLYGAEAGVWRGATSWRTGTEPGLTTPRRANPENQRDWRLSRLGGVLTAIEGPSGTRTPTANVELLFGITSSRQLSGLFDSHPLLAQNACAVYVVCDFVRKRDCRPEPDNDTRGRLNVRFPEWFADMTRLLRRVCEKSSRLKEVRIEAPVSCDTTTAPATPTHVRELFFALPQTIEVLSLQLTYRHLQPAEIQTVLGTTFEHLRSFTFRYTWSDAPGVSVGSLRSHLDAFLTRHKRLENLNLGLGEESLEIQRIFPLLKSLTLSKTTLANFASFLSNHPNLQSVSVEDFETLSDFEYQLNSLPPIGSWKINYRILVKLLNLDKMPIKMATPTGLRTLSDWTAPTGVPLPIQDRFVPTTITFLNIQVNCEKLAELNVQLGNAFHYTAYPNLYELHLGVRLDDTPDEFRITTDHQTATECLGLILLGLCSAIQLRALRLHLCPATSLIADHDLKEMTLNFPPALEYLVWDAPEEGVTQTYRVKTEVLADRLSTRRFLERTSMCHISEAPGRSTVFLDPARLLLDHSCVPPILPSPSLMA
ncbi:hypothetical protein OC846_005907 [Tilletia horrida]|uniref:Uncharacterized protein n=1 Tax=Tilletia horrida TaxID=155126 RepID=A0AAN6GKG1_9BASI|nr:hypothetical protein OC846_005907 [Tilletia horrida]